MGSRPSFSKSGKRNKELARQKKKEEKKMRRLNKTQSSGQEVSDAVLEEPASDGGTEGQEE
jgi:hypothetical protein